MLIYAPLSPGQVSFFLGTVPVCAPWLYSVYLEYKKHSSSSKVRHSDINLVELGNEAVKEDDRAVLLEGGGLHSTSHRIRSSSVTSQITRSEFGALLTYFYLSDRTNLFGESKKVGMEHLYILWQCGDRFKKPPVRTFKIKKQSYNHDLFLFLYFLLIIVAEITSFKIHHDKSPLSGKSIMYLNRHQTEEWKGWMQVLFFNVSLLCCHRNLQCYTSFYSCICMDDWIWKLLLLLHPQGFQHRKIHSGPICPLTWQIFCSGFSLIDTASERFSL